MEKTRIYNLIILDKSGSMGSIRTAAYQGCNEVLNGIRAAADEHKDEQEQLVSLLLFDSASMPYIYKCTPAFETTALDENDYVPCACTPLLDAMGMSITELKQEVSKYEDAVGMVTIITDGYENASKEFIYPQIQKLIGELKQQGWNFAFMGANQDVSKVCVDLNINIQNAAAFDYCPEGTSEAFRKDMEAKKRYYQRMVTLKKGSAGMTDEERKESYSKMNDECAYF